MHVASLHVYPVKGTRASDCERAELHWRGFENDRRWLVVKPDGYFTTQRSHPQLAAIAATPTSRGLRLSAIGMPDLDVARPDGRRRLAITVWEHRVDAALADEAAHAWLTAFFGAELRLVHMDEHAERIKTGTWTAPLPLSFADAYPVLVVTTGSLAALNAEIEARGGAPVPMRRFRPNIVVACDEPWREDYWRRLRVGRTELELVKPCDRCVVTTKDQMTGETAGEEPLATLRNLRMSADPRVKGVLFGWNAAPRALGEIEVGDRVEILEQRPEGFPLHLMSSRR
jgi:uncharacterized protein YcbX